MTGRKGSLIGERAIPLDHTRPGNLQDIVLGTMRQEIEKLQRETEAMAAGELLGYVVRRFGDKVALASSMGAEDQVITDMLVKSGLPVRIFTLDTGRLAQETYDTIAATNEKYDIRIKMLFPDRDSVEKMVHENGPNLFYEGVENRKLCCRIRKIIPLQRELATLDGWITGLRREQSVTRDAVGRIAEDEANGLIKINPLADWTTEQVWDYIRSRDIPYNPLHDQGYPSIGCAACTRAIGEGQDIRDGRWWWETPEQKECGLHVVDGKLIRKNGDG